MCVCLCEWVSVVTLSVFGGGVASDLEGEGVSTYVCERAERVKLNCVCVCVCVC